MRKGIKIGVVLATVVTVGVILCIPGFTKASDTTVKTIKKQKQHNYKPIEVVKPNTHEKMEKTKKSKVNNEAMKIYEQNTTRLMLVNKNVAVPENYTPTLVPICEGRLVISDIVVDDLKNMLAAASNAGYSYWIASAYRSAEKQKSLIDQSIKKYETLGMSYEEAKNKTEEELMTAGHSEHETGLAIDILCADNLIMDVNQEKLAGNRWMREHCEEYGFILRYPKDKVDKTKISYEPWHFRYVGKAAASYMKANHLTLEEFHHCMMTD